VGFVKTLGEKPPTGATDARLVAARVIVYDLRDPSPTFSTGVEKWKFFDGAILQPCVSTGLGISNLL
jgi:hypothetical protein